MCLLDDLLDLCPCFYGCGHVNEVGGVEVAFHGEGEPLVVGFRGLLGDAACEFDVVRAASVEPAYYLGVVDVEGAGDVEVGATVCEEGEGVEVLGALGEAFLVVFGCGEFRGGIVSGESG